MNIPMELADILKWRDTGTNEAKPAAIGMNREPAVDRYFSTMHPVFEDMVQFGVDYHSFMDNNDIAGLMEFTEKYKDSSYGRLATFVTGLQMDIEAVKNTLLYPHISNGLVEGNNNTIKCAKRVGGGRAKIDLLSATIIIRQLDKDPVELANTG